MRCTKDPLCCSPSSNFCMYPTTKFIDNYVSLHNFLVRKINRKESNSTQLNSTMNRYSHTGFASSIMVHAKQVLTLTPHISESLRKASRGLCSFPRNKFFSLSSRVCFNNA
ncbi:LOW QUALITY PROTEIN: hypothetical protein TorRG33x02_214900 [Trema orientale]|uniref:Uncharacterized protein n=1 Tax=Trema orientale TaxID=63057 RepID=A0A2P5EB30_TREOI|nr:LOW QUALITY PROTEIN: hypothetical protein TorRG33x02_214900 [Trema orientale]